MRRRVSRGKRTELMGLQPGLVYLMRKRWASRVRSWFRGFHTWRGRAAAGAALVLFMAWVIGIVASTATTIRSAPDAVRTTAPVVILLIAVSNIIFSRPDVGIVFAPAEVGLLFPAPVSRRQLLVYRIICQLLAASAASVLFSFFVWRHAGWWITAFLTTFLGMWLLQIVQMAVAMLAAYVQQQTFRRLKRWTILAIVICVGLALGSTLTGQAGNGEAGLIARLSQHPLGQILTWPLRPFGNLLASERLWPDAALWFSVVLGFNLSLTSLLVSVECNFLERSLQATERLSARLRRVRSGIFASSRRGGIYRSFRLSPRWRMAGVGPMWWKQCIGGIRSAKGIVRMLLVFGIALMLPVLMSSQNAGLTQQAVSLLGVMSIVFLPQMLRMDFRGDVDRIETLRTLPIPDWSIVVGQLCTPVMMASIIQWTVLGIVALAEGRWPGMFTIAAVFNIPLNILIYEVENFTFLLYPHRTPAAGMADLQSFIRHTLVTLTKMASVVAIAALVSVPGAVVYWLSEGHVIVTGAAVWLAAILGEILLLPLVVLAYRRFDSARIAPE